MRAAVGQAGAGHDLAQHQVGEVLADGRPGARTGRGPKKKVATPLASAGRAESQCSERTRSAPASLARAARSSSVGAGGARCGCRRTVTPIADSRPSMRRARSMTSSASTRPWAVRPGVVPPWPGSSTTVRPDRLCPERRTSSRSRRVCGEPPETDRRRSAKARSVSGPTDAVRSQAVRRAGSPARPARCRARTGRRPARGEAEGVAAAPAGSPTSSPRMQVARGVQAAGRRGSSGRRRWREEVSGPTMPSTISPRAAGRRGRRDRSAVVEASGLRRCRRGRLAVVASVGGRAASRVRTSATAGPRLPRPSRPCLLSDPRPPPRRKSAGRWSEHDRPFGGLGVVRLREGGSGSCLGSEE